MNARETHLRKLLDALEPDALQIAASLYAQTFATAFASANAAHDRAHAAQRDGYDEHGGVLLEASSVAQMRAADAVFDWARVFFPAAVPVPTTYGSE